MAYYSIELVLEGIEMLGSTPKECFSQAVKLWEPISSVLFSSTQVDDPVPSLATNFLELHPDLSEQILELKRSPMLVHRLLKEYQRLLLQRFNFKTLPFINEMLQQSNLEDSSTFRQIIELLHGHSRVVFSWLDLFDVPNDIRASFVSKIRSQSQSTLSPLMLKHTARFFWHLTLPLSPALSNQECRSILSISLSEEDIDHLFSFIHFSMESEIVSSEDQSLILSQLSEIQMLEQLEPFLIQVALHRISDFIIQLHFQERYLLKTFQWFHHVLFPNVALCLTSSEPNQVYSTLIIHAFKIITLHSAQSFFDLVVNQDDFLDTLLDLRLCLKATNEYSAFIEIVQSQLKNRLLHPGARTIDIILFFVETIKFFRTLDPSGALLHECAKELCEYLRLQRKDTVKSIIQVLFDPSRGLRNELAGDEIVLPRKEPVLKITDIIHFDYIWHPPKVSSESKDFKKTLFLPSADILSILVSVYESKDIFIQEYQMNMSEALLKKLDFELDDFIEDTEQLKARFGESSLIPCDAMLRDVKESERLNEMAHSEFLQETPVYALIISHLFWPSLETHSSSLHSTIQKYLDEFSSYFEKVRMSRHLQWLPQFGQVELEIMLDNETTPHDVSCTPLQASVLFYFTTSSKWNEYNLAMVTNLSPQWLQSILLFWRDMGFLIYLKPTQTWQILATREYPLTHAVNETEFDFPTFMTTPFNEQEDVHVPMYKNFIQSFLINQSLTVDQIHAKLNLVIMHQKKPGLGTVLMLLKEMAQQGVIEVHEDGRYSKKM